MANICDLNNQKAKIDYPTFWQYKVIVEANIDVKKMVSELVTDGREYKVEFSHFSENKKYASHNVTVNVFSENERLELFSLLKKSAKFVL